MRQVTQSPSYFLDYTHFLTYSGNIYIGDFYNQRIRKVTISTGIITTVAGSSTSGSYSGDNGQATSAGLYQPVGVNLDAAGTCLFPCYFSEYPTVTST